MTTDTRTPAHRSRLLPQLIKFGAVGAVGFVVNLAVFNGLMLTVLANVHARTLFATVIATLVAIGTNWVGNRYWAFAGSAQRRTPPARASSSSSSASPGMGIPLLCVWVSHYLLGLRIACSPTTSRTTSSAWRSARSSVSRSTAGGCSPPSAARTRARRRARRPIRRRTSRRARPAEQAPVTGSTLARTPDRGLVGD